MKPSILLGAAVLVIAVFGEIATAGAATALVPKSPELGARAWVLQDFDSGRVIAVSNPDIRLEPASLTKMLTVYVAFSELKDGNIGLEDRVLVSEKAWKTTGSRMFIEVDKQVSVEDLLMGVIVQSGNDAAVALAEYIAGDEAAFAGLMNQYAKRLGMTNSNFENSTGLPGDDHYTTAKDLARLSIALIRDFPTLYAWHAIRKLTFNDIEQPNRNKLLWRDESVDGIKTGYTSSAGYCLVASAKRDEMRLVSVVLGSQSEKSRAEQTQTLLNYGFRFYETHRLYGAGEKVAKVRIWKGEKEDLSIGLSRDLFVTLPRGQYKSLDAKLEIEANIVAPATRGESKGKVILKLGDESLGEYPLVVLESVAKGNLWRRFSDNIRLMFE